MATYLKNNNMLPAICFVFSRKNVEYAAKELDINLLSDDDLYPASVEIECKNMLMHKVPNYKEYLDLPEYRTMVSLLQKGIAIHHAGVMPILREMVELLFDKGFIKLLFATETFAVGINMPTKTVIFSSLEKWDGAYMRLLHPHEYTQMAGRAGRRGLDTLGHVIHCNNLFDVPTSTDYKHLLCGSPLQIVSKFQISYGLILNLIASGSCSMSDLERFVKQSMISKDITKEVVYYDAEIYKINELLVAARETLLSTTTPLEDIRAHRSLTKSIPFTSQNKKKHISRELKTIQLRSPSFEADMEIYNKIDALEDSLKTHIYHKESANNYNRRTIGNVCSILETEGYITIDDAQLYDITILGKDASQLMEVHPTAFSKVLFESNYLADFSAPEIACLLSMFSSMRVAEEFTIRHPDTGITHLDKYANMLRSEIDRYVNIETAHQVYMKEMNVVHFNLFPIIMKWCECDTEESCKDLLRTIVGLNNQIFMGDFIKAILKINNTVAEIEKIAEINNNVPLLEKLRLIPGLTLKYVASNQSLYI